MRGVPPEVILFIGGGIVTVIVAVFVVLLLVRASREHDQVISRERDAARMDSTNRTQSDDSASDAQVARREP